MKKNAFLLFTAAILFLSTAAFAGLQKETPYIPASSSKYKELKKLFPSITAEETEKSLNISRRQEFTDLINEILAYLNYKKLVKQTKKLPPILLLYSEQNTVLSYSGGMYFDMENVIVLNANNFSTGNIRPNSLPENMQKTIDFVSFSSIISHELMHYEDIISEIGKSDISDTDSGILKELNAYRRSEKVIEYFMKMTKAEADEIIPIPGFYTYVQSLEDYFINIRKNYIKIGNAAGILLDNEKKICETLGLDGNKFKLLSFSPKIVFNEKNGGHIVVAESRFLKLPVIFFEINILSGTMRIMNTSSEIENFKREAKKINMVDKNSYTVTAPKSAKQ